MVLRFRYDLYLFIICCVLALYYCFNLLVLLVATSCSAVIVNLSKRGESREKVPRLVKKVSVL